MYVVEYSPVIGWTIPMTWKLTLYSQENADFQPITGRLTLNP
jgi:hypothetical protein